MKYETLQLHAGHTPDESSLSRAVPIYQTSSYVFRDTEHAKNLFNLEEEGNIYTRLSNHTTDVFEKRIAELEGGVGALAVASGLSAQFIAINNTLALAKYLQNHKKVKSVSYPSLENNKNYEIAKKYFKKGACAVLSFEVEGTKEATTEFVSNLKIVSHLANIGDSKTLIIQPSATTHHQLNENEQKAAGITPSLLRVSLGIEHIDDIIDDFEQAFSKI